MSAWLRDLTSRERQTLLACWGGWTLDGGRAIASLKGAAPYPSGPAVGRS